MPLVTNNSVPGGSVINVADFCADLGLDITTGTPVHTAAVQAAIDSAIYGDTLYFPAGKYKFKDIALKSGITVLGDNGQQEDIAGVTHLYLTTNAASSLFRVPLGVTHVTFDAVDLIGRKSAQSGGTCHGIYVVEGASIEDGDYCAVVVKGSCNVRDFLTDGIHLGHHRRGLIVEPGAQVCTNGRHGINLDSSDSYIHRASCYQNGAAGINDGSGDNFIVGVDCFQNGTYGIDLPDTYTGFSARTTLSGVHINENALGGVHVAKPGVFIGGGSQFSANSYPVAATGSNIVVEESALGQVLIDGCIFDTDETKVAYAPQYDIFLVDTARAVEGKNLSDGINPAAVAHCNTPAQLD